MKRTRVKICGITRLEDALLAVESGADALGFVFYKPSPRYIEPQAAAEIIAKLPAFVTTTALFVDESSAAVTEIMATTKVDLLQFHGHEEAAFCQQFQRPYIKAIRMKPDLDLEREAQQYAAAQAILLDAYRPGVPGGTGEIFNWDRIPKTHPAAIILAGGLSPNNVAEAITKVTPYAVDVSGGVEKSKGIKDAMLVKNFINEVIRAYSN